MTATEELIPAYANAGVRVFPLTTALDGVCSCGWAECPSPGKHPAIRNAHPKGDPLRGQCRGECGRLGHGAHDATTDIGVIAEWLAQWPNANWGGVPPQGVVILDLDPRNGGWDTLRALEAKYNRLPHTLTAKTGGDGRHYWFSYSGPSRGKIGAGLDVKHAPGYVCLPPSVHASGRSYAWIRKMPAVPTPRWLQRLLDPPRPVYSPTPHGPGNIDRLARFLSTAKEGERNSSLFWAACRAHELELDPTPLVEVALSIGLTLPEITATISSAERAPQRCTQ